MKIRIITSEGSQELEVTGSPVIICVGDKKYLLTERGSFKRIRNKLKKDLIEIMGERQYEGNQQQ